MALSKSPQTGQAPITCQLCEEGGMIQWRCEQCVLLICDKCKKLHLKITKDHRIVDIKSVLIPQKCQVCNAETKLQAKCEDCQMFLCQSCHNGHRIIPATKDHKISAVEDENQALWDVQRDRRRIRLNVLKQYLVDTKNIHCLTVSDDGSLWVGDRDLKQVLHIKLTDNRVTVLSTFDIHPFSLAISPSGSTLVSTKSGILKVINMLTGQNVDSKFSIEPFGITCVHVTKDKNLFVGGNKQAQGVVILMNNDGKHLVKYDKDKDQQLFKYPTAITSTQNGNIFIIDAYGDLRRARLVVIMPDSGDIIYHYGYPDINSDQKPFFSISIVVTPKDNVLTIDHHTNTIYILNNKGIFISFYDLACIGISSPISLAVSRTDTLYIGCAGVSKDGEDPKAPLYELEYSGV